jgi:hypothetical protein
MVEVHQQHQAAAQRDEKAVEIFRDQWQLYRKFLENDYLSNAGAYAKLHSFLVREMHRPFRFVDLACGDASGIVPALQGTAIAHYCGIDLALPALELARGNLGALNCEVTLEQADFVEAMRRRTEPADVVWISLSLHHLPTAEKGMLMREVSGGLAHDGAFLIYEPTFRDGEDRPKYLDRFEEIGRREWTALTPEDFANAMSHVRACDLPETASQWEALGRAAGFARIAELYISPDDLFRMYSFRF